MLTLLPKPRYRWSDALQVWMLRHALLKEEYWKLNTPLYLHPRKPTC